MQEDIPVVLFINASIESICRIEPASIRTYFIEPFYINETFGILIVNHIVSVPKPKNPFGFDALLETRINHVSSGTILLVCISISSILKFML